MLHCRIGLTILFGLCLTAVLTNAEEHGKMRDQLRADASLKDDLALKVQALQSAEAQLFEVKCRFVGTEAVTVIVLTCACRQRSSAGWQVSSMLLTDK